MRPWNELSLLKSSSLIRRSRLLASNLPSLRTGSRFATDDREEASDYGGIASKCAVKYSIKKNKIYTLIDDSSSQLRSSSRECITVVLFLYNHKNGVIMHYRLFLCCFGRSCARCLCAFATSYLFLLPAATTGPLDVIHYCLLIWIH